MWLALKPPTKLNTMAHRQRQISTSVAFVTFCTRCALCGHWMLKVEPAGTLIASVGANFVIASVFCCSMPPAWTVT
jgi:hypothetical protein